MFGICGRRVAAAITQYNIESRVRRQRNETSTQLYALADFVQIVELRRRSRIRRPRRDNDNPVELYICVIPLPTALELYALLKRDATRRFRRRLHCASSVWSCICACVYVECMRQPLEQQSHPKLLPYIYTRATHTLISSAHSTTHLTLCCTASTTKLYCGVL